MTCIVGYMENDKVIIGADSLGSNGHSKTIYVESKAFINGPMIIGYTTSFRMGQILEYHLVIPEQLSSQTDMAFMVMSFVPAVRHTLSTHGFTPASEKDADAGVQFLVGYKGQLYEISSDFQVSKTVDPFASVGSGYQFALGSLASTQELDIPVSDKVRIALEVAERYTTTVSGPFNYRTK
ncbi:Ntn hydrolase family protein [Gluconacetobacter dulcium]|nr:hypothetical protein [Gluconacetobacter dulcium]